MNETEAGALNKSNLIDECAEALCEWEDYREGCYAFLLEVSANSEYEFSDTFRAELKQLRAQSINMLNVLRKRGLITEQGLELIKREETK